MPNEKEVDRKHKSNIKQKERYNNDPEYRKKKQNNARKYYEKHKYGNFEITFSNETKKISFQ